MGRSVKELAAAGILGLACLPQPSQAYIIDQGTCLYQAQLVVVHGAYTCDGESWDDCFDACNNCGMCQNYDVFNCTDFGDEYTAQCYCGCA